VARLGTERGVPQGLAVASTQVLECDAVLARIIPAGSLEQMIFRVDALHWIERRGVPVMNSARAIEKTVDKFYTTALLQEAGLPTPETVVCENATEAMAAVARLGDVIIKPIFGSMGHGMVRVNDPDVAFRVVRSLEQFRVVFYVQRVVDHGGRAIRALRAAAVVGADYAGVDLLPSTDGSMFVLEVNGIPGWQGLKQATGIDVAGAVVEHVEQLVRKKNAPTGPPAEIPA